MKLKAYSGYSYKVKEEVALSIMGRKRSDACLLGLLCSCQNKELLLTTDNPVLRELFIRLCSYASGDKDCITERIERSRGRPARFILEVPSSINRETILKRLGITGVSKQDIIEKANRLSDNIFGSFVSGLFLSCGTMSSPEKEYHLELSFGSEQLRDWLIPALKNRFGIISKPSERKKSSSYILYLKGSEGIEDFLTLVGAPMSSLEIMNVKVYKDIRNRVNRATNCDTANCDRQDRSCARQIEAIRLIQSSRGGLGSLPEELREAAWLRLSHPELSLSELCRELDPPISKSGLNHRLKRIEEYAGTLESVSQPSEKEE